MATVPSLVNVIAFVVVVPTPTSPKVVAPGVRLGPRPYTWTLVLLPPAAEPGLARNTICRPPSAATGPLKPPAVTGAAVLRSTAGVAVVKTFNELAFIFTAPALPSGANDGSSALPVTAVGAAPLTDTLTAGP